MNKQKKYIDINGLLIRILVFAGIIIATIFSMVYKMSNELEMMTEDQMYQRPGAVPYQVKIIAIDDETLNKLGPYSEWNRDYFALLLNYLYENPDSVPLVVGIDVLFSGTNNSSQDESLVYAAKNAGNVILASKVDFETKIENDGTGYFLNRFISNETKAFDELSAVTESGFTNARIDEDGYVRNAYSVVDGYESFAYQIAKEIASKDEADLQKNNLGYLSGIDLTYLAPVFDLVYTGNPGDFEIIPMSAVLEHKIPASYFADNIVLVGAYEEGMMDAYSVPIRHRGSMYGVEIQANILWAMLNHLEAFTVPLFIQILLVIALLGSNGYIIYKSKLFKGILSTALYIAGYVALCFGLYGICHYKLKILYIPIGLLIQFLIVLLMKYVEMQKYRAEEMQRTLFSMADSMAEAIEGRTPYNANHTKNVAKRSMEMLDYINQMHKEKRTEMRFSDKDKKELYLAAMLHDIGKMDVPLEVMDKPTKLGNREEKLRDRLTIIKLSLERDSLKNQKDKKEVENEIQKIDLFLDKLGLFNCGKPLSDEDKIFIEDMGQCEYEDSNGNVIPYITKEELADLSIKAGTLSEEERIIMQSHVVYTEKILSHVYFGSDFEHVKSMASNHHELLNAKGYPNGIGEDQIDVMTRILTIMDIFDSLIADDRPYKKPKSIPVAFEILDEEAEAGKIDKNLLEIAKEYFGK